MGYAEGRNMMAGLKCGITIFIFICLHIVLASEYVSGFEKERLAQEEAEQGQQEKLAIKALLKKAGLLRDSLPSNYRGHDPEVIFKKLAKVSSVDTDFEKTEDRRRRLEAINLDEIYAFRIPEKNNLYIGYNPDEEVFKINISPTLRVNIWSGKQFKEIDINVIKTKNEKITSYVGVNAFGAKTVVERHTGIKYGLHIINQKSFIYTAEVSFAMPLNEAKKYKNTLSVLFICKPVFKNDILTFKEMYYNEPTFSHPVSEIYDVFGINVELLEIWVYDLKTGKVFEKKEFY